MPSEALTGGHLPYKVSGADEFLRWRSFFGPKSDLTYRLIEHIEFDGLDLKQSLLTGTLLRDCRFTGVDFTKSDLDGMRIERCTFTDCNLYNADIRSADLIDTTFVRTSLRGVYLTDSTFERCRLEKVSFADTAVTECTFRDSSLVRCLMRNSTWTLNRFERVELTRMVLGDCTFLYAIMLGCALKEVRINAESVGMVYGLGPEDLRRVSYIYLGDEQDAPQDLDVSHILDFYRERRWMIGVTMLRMSARVTSVIVALQEYFDWLFAQMEEGGPLRSDELRFMVDVLAQLRAEGRLPLITVMDLVERTVALGGTPHSRVQAALQRIAGPSHRLLTEMLDELETKRLPLPDDGDEPVLLQAVFEHQPGVSLTEVMDAVAAAAALGPGLPARQVRASSGSYVETVATALSSVAAFQVFLYLVNGCLVQITTIRARTEVLRQKRLPARWLDMARDPAVAPPRPYVEAMERVRRASLSFPYLSEPGLGGYDDVNVRSLELLSRGGEAPSAFDKELE